MKRIPIAQYWPAALFTVSYVAAVALVIQANRSFGDEPVHRTERQEQSWRTDADSPFSALDDVDASKTGGSHVPLLLDDFGDQFDTDHVSTRQRKGLMALVGRVSDAVQGLRRRTAEERRLADRSATDAATAGRRYRINWWSSDRNSFLGSADLELPGEIGDLPPLPPAAEWAVGDATVMATSGRRLDIKIDPQLFRDETAMAEFIARLRATLVIGGLEPEFHVTDATGGTAPLPASMIASAPPGSRSPSVPPQIPVVRAQSAAAAGLRRAPSDIARGVPEPEFRPDLDAVGSVTVLRPRQAEPPPEAPIRPTAAAEPLGPPLPKPPDDVRDPDPQADAAPSAVTLPGSQGDVATAPRPAAPSSDGPVSIRIRLASFPSQAAADRAVAQLRQAGYGGSKVKSSDGLDFWIVHSRVFTNRREANEALGRIRGMGYEAWQS